MKLSVKLMNYNFFVRSFIPYVTTPANIIRYGLTPIQVTALTTFLADWILKFNAYSNAETNNKITNEDANEAYLIGYPQTESVRMVIKSNVTLKLSAIERQVLNIKKPSPRTGHVKPQANGPAFVCISYELGVATIIAVDPKNPRIYGKPEGMDIGLKQAFTEVGEPLPGDKDFARLPDETTAEFELIISGANAGKIMSLKGFYINARGEEGDEGFTIMMLV